MRNHRHRQFLGAVLTAAFLGGCAAGPTKEQKDESIRAIVVCMEASSNEIDDGQSDPGTVAQATQSACGMEIVQAVRLSTSGMMPRQADRWESGFRKAVADNAVLIVLQERKKRR